MKNRTQQQIRYLKKKYSRGWKGFSVVAPSECVEDIKTYYAGWKDKHPEHWTQPANN